MRITAQSLDGRYLVIDGERVLDTHERTLSQPKSSADLGTGWHPYRGPQNLARRLRDVDPVDEVSVTT